MRDKPAGGEASSAERGYLELLELLWITPGKEAAEAVFGTAPQDLLM